MSENVALRLPSRVRRVALPPPDTQQTPGSGGGVLEGITPARETVAPPLHGKRLLLFQALVGGMSVGGAASRAGLSARQATRVLSDHDFRDALREAQAEVVEIATARLSVSLDLGLSVLRSLAADASTPPATRAAAAGRLVEFALRAVEAEQLGARLAQLEMALGVVYDAR